MINVGIIGATGYTGEELISILLRHPQVRITYLAAKIDKPAPIAEIFPKFKNRIDLVCGPPSVDLAISICDLLFLALPHTISMKIAPKLLKANKRVVDLSADYRLKNVRIYEKFYNKKHNDAQNLKEAIYGLPEIYRAKIKKARLVANPGCYPTAAILGLAPLIACEINRPESIIIDAKTGITGAGRRGLLEYSFSELNEDAYAYKINMHQHVPEISQELSKIALGSVKLTFVPHLFSINRGILETIYIKQNQNSRINPSTRLRVDGQRPFDKLRVVPNKVEGRSRTIKNQKLIKLYKNFYKKEPFIRIKEENEFVRLKDVVNTNYCDIAVKSFPEDNLIIIVSAIDNLGKGAASQAVQNMNIMCGFSEELGLI